MSVDDLNKVENSGFSQEWELIYREDTHLPVRTVMLKKSMHSARFS